MNPKVLSLLGFASKSGNLSFGADAARESLARKRSRLILVASDLSAKSRKEMCYFAARAGVEVLDTGVEMEALYHATGHKGGILSVNDSGFAAAIKGGMAYGEN